MKILEDVHATLRDRVHEILKQFDAVAVPIDAPQSPQRAPTLARQTTSASMRDIRSAASPSALFVLGGATARSARIGPTRSTVSVRVSHPAIDRPSRASHVFPTRPITDRVVHVSLTERTVGQDKKTITVRRHVRVALECFVISRRNTKITLHTKPTVTSRIFLILRS